MAELSIQDELITIAHSAKSGFMQKKTHNVSLFCLNAIQILYAQILHEVFSETTCIAIFSLICMFCLLSP